MQKKTYTFHIETDGSLTPGINYILQDSALYLAEQGFGNLIFSGDSFALEGLDTYRKFLLAAPTFITVHYLSQAITMDQRYQEDPNRPSLKPNPILFKHANMGKRVESHYMVTGAPNTGKTVIAEVLKRSLEEFAPGAKVYLIDTDDCSYSFFDHTSDAERAMHVSYIKELEHTFGVSPISEYMSGLLLATIPK